MSSKGPIVDDEGLYDLVVTADVRIQHRSSSAGSAGDGEGERSGRGKNKDRSQRRAELMRRYGSLIAKSELHLRRKDDRASLIKKPRRAAALAADVPSANASLRAAAANDVASASAASASLCAGATDVASASASLSAAAVDMQSQRDQARRKIAAMEKTVDISDGSCVEVAAFGEVAALQLRSFSRTLFECVTNFKLVDDEVE